MIIKKLLLSLLVTSIVSLQSVCSQVEKQSEKIKVYSPTTANTSNSDNSYKWTIKTDLFSFIAGEVPLICEYRLANKLSIEGSAGLTYSFWPNGVGFFGDKDSNSNKTEAYLGYAFRAGVKYYPSSDWDAIEGWGFGVQFFTTKDNRRYKKDGTYILEDVNPNDYKDTEKRIGALLTISKQVFWDSNISYEYMVGVGISSTERKFHKIDTDYSTRKTKFTPILNQKFAPSFKFGLRIGFGN